MSPPSSNCSRPAIRSGMTCSMPPAALGIERRKNKSPSRGMGFLSGGHCCRWKCSCLLLVGGIGGHEAQVLVPAVDHVLVRPMHLRHHVVKLVFVDLAVMVCIQIGEMILEPRAEARDILAQHMVHFLHLLHGDGAIAVLVIGLPYVLH